MVLVIVIIVFGARKLPSIGTGLGLMIRNFRKSVKDGDDALNPGDEGKKPGNDKT